MAMVLSYQYLLKMYTGIQLLYIEVKKRPMVLPCCKKVIENTKTLVKRENSWHRISVVFVRMDYRMWTGIVEQVSINSFLILFFI